jgi:hypothetical protein
MPRRFPRGSQLAGVVQDRVVVAASALSDILQAIQAHQGKVRKARSNTRQGHIRGALRIVQQLPIGPVLEDPDLGLVSLEGLETELQSLAGDVSAGLEEIVHQGNVDETRDKMGRLEALYVTLGRGLEILQAPQQAGTDPASQLQFDLGERVTSLMAKIGSMLRLLENTRDAENLRISSLRPQVEKALELLHRAGVVPQRGTRVWWQSSRRAPERNRVARAIK